MSKMSEYPLFISPEWAPMPYSQKTVIPLNTQLQSHAFQAFPQAAATRCARAEKPWSRKIALKIHLVKKKLRMENTFSEFRIFAQILEGFSINVK